MRKFLTATLVALALSSQAAEAQVALNIRPLTQPITLVDGTQLAVSVFYHADLGSYFAGCVINDPNSSFRGWQIYSVVDHWQTDGVPARNDDGDVIERTLDAVIAGHGSYPAFILQLISQQEDCMMEKTGFKAANSPKHVTNQMLVGALEVWEPAPTQWPGFIRMEPRR